MFKVSSASLQIFIDTPDCVLEDRVQYSTVHIPNVFCDETVRNTVFLRVLYCNRQVHRDFLITLYIYTYTYTHDEHQQVQHCGKILGRESNIIPTA